MDKNQPWSVKGIEPETRNAAKMAARRAGLTVGAWLNQVILDAAAGDMVPARVSREGAAGMLPAGPDLNPLPGRQGQTGPYSPAGEYGAQVLTAQRPASALLHPETPIRQEGPARPTIPAHETFSTGQMETILDALRRYSDEIQGAIRSSTAELRLATDRIPPLADRIRPLSDHVAMLAERLEQVGEVDRRLSEAERKAEQASLQVRPLERSLSRLSERLDDSSHMPYPSPDGRYRRKGLFGKLFGD